MEHQETARHNAAIIIIHWLVLALVALAAVSAFVIDEMPDKALKASMTNLHFVFGSLVLALVVLRGTIRLATPAPPLPEHTHPHVVRAAFWGHIGLYVLMIGVPLVGVITAFYRGRGIDFGLFAINPPFEANRATGRFFKEIHEFVAYLFFAGIGGHALFALWHQIILKDGLLERMRFGTTRPDQTDQAT